MEIVPTGVMRFPGTSINDSLADRAKNLKIWHRMGGATTVQ
ncbi:hypothetical protein [Leisingera sp.]|nr:hypothetical protein [Leisingera sp.]